VYETNPVTINPSSRSTDTLVCAAAGSTRPSAHKLRPQTPNDGPPGSDREKTVISGNIQYGMAKRELIFRGQQGRWIPPASSYFISPSFLACAAHKNRFKYGSSRELQSFHRLSQSGRRKSHIHSLSTLIGRELLPLARVSKINSARQFKVTTWVSRLLIMGWTCIQFIGCNESTIHSAFALLVLNAPRPSEPT
jgi:hypothetical protein